MDNRIRTRERHYSALGIFLAVLLIFCSPSGFSPRTPRGLQCPTAPVQTIRDVTMVKCCGKLVAKTTFRKPHEGEVGFKQCLCAERKNAEAQQKALGSESIRQAIELALIGPVFHLPEISLIPRDHQVSDLITKQCFAPAFAPPTPPPQAI